MNTCPICQSTFELGKQKTKKFCSRKCMKINTINKYQNKIKSNPQNQCIQCKNLTVNPKFCSSVCNATYNNKKRNKKIYHCSKCDIILSIGSSNKAYNKYCSDCFKQHCKNFKDWSKITISSFRLKIKNTYQFHSRIRSLARRKIKKSPCKICGYDKHIEVCHIKPISDFLPTQTIGEINDITNLVCLCPNCHWEFDNGLLKVADLGVAPNCTKSL